MKVLLDASAIINLIRRRKGNSLNLLEGNAVLTLTPYEVGNVVWKEAKLEGLITLEEAKLIVEAFELLLKRMEVIEPELRRVLQVAVMGGITFYDASYVATAMDKGLYLVTDDMKLIRKVRSDEFSRTVGEATVLSSEEFESLRSNLS